MRRTARKPHTLILVVELHWSIKEADLPYVRDVFFLSSTRKEFKSAHDRETFWDNYTRYYLYEKPDYNLIASTVDRPVSGYLMGCDDSAAALPFYKDRLAFYAHFADQFEAYPAHFHINTHPDKRGMGIGSYMLNRFVETLRERGVRGVHLVTSPDAENRAFYQKNGFTFELVRRWRGIPLLFMGRDLSASGT